MGYILALATISIWSVNIILAKFFAAAVLPFQISFGRWAVAVIVLLPFTIVELWQKRSVIIQNWKYIVLLSLLGVVFSNTLIYKAAETTAPINIGLLQIIFPLFLTILSVVFLGVRLMWQQICGILLAVLGVLTVLVRGDFTLLSQIQIRVGDGYMLLNTALFAIYSFIQYRRPKELSQPALLSATAIVGMFALFALSSLTEGLPSLNITNVELFLYLGIFNSVIAFLFWNMALEKIGQIKAAMFFYLMPLLTAVSAWVVLGEKIVAFEIIGGLLIISGIVVLNLKNKKAD